MADQYEDLEAVLGESVRALRIDRRLTQVELADSRTCRWGPEETRKWSRIGDFHHRESGARVESRCVLQALAPAVATFNPLQPVDSRGSTQRRGPRRVRRVRQLTYRQVAVVEVWAWVVEWARSPADPASGHYVFAYAPEWIATGVELSPLEMPLSRAPV